MSLTLKQHDALFTQAQRDAGMMANVELVRRLADIRTKHPRERTREEFYLRSALVIECDRRGVAPELMEGHV